MAIEEDILHDVQLSLGRCAKTNAFFERFCANFKVANISVPTYGGRQPRLLREDLAKLLNYAGDADFATRSGAVALNVPPQLSKFWVEALMMTVREFDDKFTPELERKWRAVLRKGLASSASLKLPA